MAFTRHARRYGTRRLRAELRAEGHAVGRYALRIWLRRHGLWALSTRPARRSPTQRPSWPKTAYWGCRPPPPRTKSGSAGAGAT
ncbi:IS3 family transposase [Hymenobacter canadensis]|uniref:IS3 family transposase n=1 Tax=Hymenobacter canadensis TaxID=2999067 RepID=UPI0033133CA5